MYEESKQGTLYTNERRLEREACAKILINIYKGRLKKLFDKRFLEQSKTLRNSRNSLLHEFMFCVGSDRPAAIRFAKRTTKHLLEI